MHVPSSDSRSSGRPDAAMTPMIDVVFLLLIFFVWTASFQAVETLLPSQLAAQVGQGRNTDLQQEDFERIVVRIGATEVGVQWTVNGQPVSTVAELTQRLDQLASIRAALPVVIDPDPEIALGDVIEVYDCARQVGLVNIQFTTHSPTVTGP